MTLPPRGTLEAPLGLSATEHGSVSREGSGGTWLLHIPTSGVSARSATPTDE